MLNSAAPRNVKTIDEAEPFPPSGDARREGDPMMATRRGLTFVAFVAMTIAAGSSDAARSAEELVAELESLADQEGEDWVRIGKVETGGLSQSQLAKIPLTLRKDACYRFLTVGGDGIGEAADPKADRPDGRGNRGQPAEPIGEASRNRKDRIERNRSDSSGPESGRSHDHDTRDTDRTSGGAGVHHPVRAYPGDAERLF